MNEAAEKIMLHKKYPWDKQKKEETFMTKEKILERIKLLENEKEQVKATVIAYEGAIQDCRHWLQQLEEPTVKNDG